MTTINLKDFYSWHTHDEYIEVSDEVAAELRADKLYEAAYQRRLTRHKAQYSLDCEDGIEYSACLQSPRPRSPGTQGAVYPAVERAQFPAGDPGPPDRRSHHSWHKHQSDC